MTFHCLWESLLNWQARSNALMYPYSQWKTIHSGRELLIVYTESKVLYRCIYIYMYMLHTYHPLVLKARWLCFSLRLGLPEQAMRWLPP